MSSQKFYVYEVGSGLVEGACECSLDKDESQIEIQTFNTMRCPRCSQPVELVFTEDWQNEEYVAQLESV